MRKPNKSSLMHAITKLISHSDEFPSENFVLEGGELHRVRWQTNSTYQNTVN